MERRERKNAVTVLAPAKLNLALDVVGLLPNGYHALDMTMQTITLYERVMLRRSAGLSLRLPGSLVQPNDKNTAIKAALAFFHYTGLLAGVDITIYKNTPVRAGMAGGSADAAAVLVGLNALYGAKLSMSELCALGAGIGSVALLPMAGRAIWLSCLLLGVSFCLIGLAISAPDFFTALKILLVVVFLWLASPVASHLLCRLEVETNEDRGQYMNVHEKSLAQEREETAHAEEEQA